MHTDLSRPDADNPDTLIVLFNALFEPTWRTCLVRGDDEPLYTPARDASDVHRIIFARGYFASALHEISHWCIAGHARRQLEDYGYWYIPDGRDIDQQAAFEQAEVKPQAIESLLAEACGRRFHVSVDNLEGDAEVDRAAFAARVHEQAVRYREEGLPRRAAVLCQALKAFYKEGVGVRRITAQFLPALNAGTARC